VVTHFFGLHIKSLINLKIVSAAFGIVGGNCPPLAWSFVWRAKPTKSPRGDETELMVCNCSLQMSRCRRLLPRAQLYLGSRYATVRTVAQAVCLKPYQKSYCKSEVFAN